MDYLEAMRACCLSFPHASERVQWEDHLLFCIGDKMFAMCSLNPSATLIINFKCDPETFAELTEKEGIIPAPYLARYHWVALRTDHPLNKKQLEKYLKESYDMVSAKLPRKVRESLGGAVKEQKSKGKK